MIVPMKKVSLVILETRRREALSRLRKVGVVHLETAGNSSRELESINEDLTLIARAVSVLPAAKPGKAGSAESDPEEDREKVLEKAREIVNLAEQRRICREECDKLSREIDKLAPWGDFDPETLKDFSSRGLLFRLYEVGRETMKKLPTSGTRFVVYEGKSKKGIAWIARDENDFPSGIEPVTLPAVGPKELEKLLGEKESEIAALDRKIPAVSSIRTDLEKSERKLKGISEYEQAVADLGVEGRLAYLTGFVPDPRIDDLRRAADSEGWALLIQDPEPEDPVPTCVENPPAIRIIQPIFNFLGTVPGYREVDISFFFLVFFSLFFAMIIGDAAYGSILLSLSLYFSLKARARTGSVPDILILFMLMATGTVVWGALTGNWFGFEPIAKTAPFSWFVVPSLSSWNPRSSDAVKFITFVIGTVHLSIAHIWNFMREIKRKPFIRAFAQLGWLSMVLGLYFLVLNMVLDPIKFPVPGFAKIMIITGFLMVLFLSRQEGNFFKGIVNGFGGLITTFLDSIAAFSDIISYIRLFAVGLASIEIAKSFNGMAEGLMTSPVGIFFGILVVILGHGLNMAMGGLSVIVHGVRLNVLEFSNHLGLEWSGFAYDPFREKDEQKAQ